jgi:hypothetical protein
MAREEDDTTGTAFSYDLMLLSGVAKLPSAWQMKGGPGTRDGPTTATGQQPRTMHAALPRVGLARSASTSGPDAALKGTQQEQKQLWQQGTSSSKRIRIDCKEWEGRVATPENVATRGGRGSNSEVKAAAGDEVIPTASQNPSKHRISAGDMQDGPAVCLKHSSYDLLLL